MSESTDRGTSTPDNPSPAAARSTESDEALLAQLGKQFRELWEYLCQYLLARRDLALAIGWRTARRVGIGLAASLGVAGLFIAAGWFILNGLAGGLTAWLGPVWLGQLLAGSVVLIVLGGLVWLSSRRWAKRRLDRVRRKYGQRETRQRNAFGRSAASITGQDAADRG